MPDVTEIPPLGHQDPVWRPDGKQLFYVRNGREGAKGAPIIYRWDVAKKTSSAVTGPGYLEPSFSPDGKYIAATRINAFGSDVVILDAVRGRELLRLTTDGASWAPTWSPKGDAIAFFHIDGQIVDLKMAVAGRQGPELDRRRDQGPDQRVRPGRLVAARLVHPRRPAAGDARADPPAVGVPVAQRLVTAGYLERLAERSAAVGSVLCLGLDPDPAGLARGLQPRSGGHRSVRPAHRRGGRAVRRGRQAQPRVLRGVRLRRDGRARADPGHDPVGRPRSWPTPSAAISGRPPPARPWRCSTASAPMR